MTPTISFKNQTLTVIRPAYVLERGDQVPDWGNAAEHTSTGWRVQPRAGEEVHFTGSASGEGGVARNAIVSRWWATGPPGADVDERDRIRYAGVVYEVEGPVQRWPSPTGALAHTELFLQRVEG